MNNIDNLEDFFIMTNGFIIEKDFETTKLDFISRIPSNALYHFDLFEYDNLFYVIPIHKEIIRRCEFLENIVDEYPSFGSSVVMATYDSIIKGFFDVTYFTNAVINMMILLREKYNDSKYSYEIEQNILNLSPQIDIPLHSFLNTHHAIFCYFKFYSIERDFTMSMLVKTFHTTFPKNPNEKLFDDYFGFHNGNETARDMGKFESTIFDYDRVKLNVIGNVLHTDEYDTRKFISGNGDKLIDMEQIPTRDYTYLKLMFWNLSFDRSKHILVKTKNSDDRLSYYKKYLDVDGILFLNYDRNYFPRGTNLRVIGFNNPGTDFDDRIENIVFDESLRELKDHYCNKYKNIKSITFLGDIDIIFNRFCSLSSIEKLNMPKKVRLIDSFFLFGCKNIKELTVNEVEKIGSFFIYQSNIEKLIIDTRYLKSIGEAFAFSSKITNIDLSCDILVDIGLGFMHGCKQLKTAKFNFPKVKMIEERFLANCTSLEEFELILTDNTSSIENSFLRNAKSLVKFNMPFWPPIIGDEFLTSAGSIMSIPHVSSNIIKIGNKFLKGAKNLRTFTMSSQPWTGDEFMSDCPSLISKKVFI